MPSSHFRIWISSLHAFESIIQFSWPIYKPNISVCQYVFYSFFQRKEASDHYLWETIWISFVYLKIKISTCIHYVAEMAVHCTLRSKRRCIVTSSVYIKHNPSFYSKSSWLVPSKPTRAALCCSLTCWYANYGIRPFQPARSVVPLSRID